MKTQGIYLSWIIVKDVPKAIKFYTETVGLELKEHSQEYGWAELSGPGGSLLGIAQEGHENPMRAGSNAIVTVAVDNLDKAKSHFTKMGAKLIGETIEVPGHVKMQSFMDADGNTMQLVQELTQPN